METSFFMVDETKKDSKELVIDFFLSWTLRMAIGNVNPKNVTVTDYCQRILSKLLFDDIDVIRKNYNSVKSVKTWKQWERIDLHAEIILINNNGIEVNHALLIEDKAYSKIHGNQLNNYKVTFEEEYHDRKDGNWVRRYVYFTIHDNVPIEDQKLCDEEGYRAFTMNEIRGCFWPTEDDLRLIGNDFFDEFWVKNWG